jgi:hypothetical protein
LHLHRLDHKVEIPYLISSSKDLTVTRSPKGAVCDWVGEPHSKVLVDTIIIIIN